MNTGNCPNWLSLKTPASSWKTASQKILFSWVLHKIGDNNSWTRISRREIQLELSRVCGPRISEKLKGFYEYGYLERKEPRSIVRAYEYRLNPNFASSETALEWKHFTDVIFSSSQPWKDLFRGSSVGHGFLNVSGLIVLGAIISAEVGVSTGQLQDYLRGLVSESTVRTCVKHQMAHSLVTRNNSNLLIPCREFDSLLRHYEAESGARARSRRISREIRIQRRAFIEIYGN